jgi:hypothetical protein
MIAATAVLPFCTDARASASEGVDTARLRSPRTPATIVFEIALSS